jgi:geranylgeranyl diphosphate synthase, type II
VTLPITPPCSPVFPEHLRDDVERYLEQVRFSDEIATAGLEEAMRYSLLAGGKRIRPVLALATADAIGHARESVLPLAAALELIHTYSLIHDDLPAMDDDDLRRGRLTCHKVFGDDVAILAGDALYAEAFKLLLSRQQADPANLVAVATRLASATGVQGMVGGQYIDVAGTAPDGADGLRRLHELKTGRLIGASIECVLLLDAADDDARVVAFRAFASELGKQEGADERLGKRTYVTEFGLDGARRLADECHGRAREALAEAAPAGAEELERITDFIATRSY